MNLTLYVLSYRWCEGEMESAQVSKYQNYCLFTGNPGEYGVGESVISAAHAGGGGVWGDRMRSGRGGFG